MRGGGYENEGIWLEEEGDGKIKAWAWREGAGSARGGGNFRIPRISDVLCSLGGVGL
jgi:hypothetical protein